MKQKRRITTREVYKWKARLMIDGSKQKYGFHYDHHWLLWLEQGSSSYSPSYMDGAVHN
jgi:hypothetical protein